MMIDISVDSCPHLGMFAHRFWEDLRTWGIGAVIILTAVLSRIFLSRLVDWEKHYLVDSLQSSMIFKNFVVQKP
jgi:hypothetical protein